MKERIAQLGSRFWGWTAFLRSATGLVVLAVLLVGMRLVWVHAQRPADLEENASAYGSIRNFYGRAQFSHDGSRFTYVATADDRGSTLFLHDSVAGKRTEIAENQHGIGIWKDEFDIQAGPWSPDDSAFIYTVDQELFVAEPGTNKNHVRVQIGTNVVASAVVWLNPAAFAWHEGSAFCLADRSAGGQWSVRRFPYRGQISSLVALNSHTLAWLQDNFICRVDLLQDLSGTNNPFSGLGFENDSAPLTNGLVLWLDASKLKQPDQSSVTNLEDLSPSRNAAVSNQRPPKFNAPGSANSLNGRGTIRFSSSEDLTQATGLATTRDFGIVGNLPRSVFAVMRRDAGKLMMVGLGRAGTRGGYFGVCDQWDGYYLPATMATDNKAPVGQRNWNLYSVVFDGSTQNGYVNGNLICTASSQLNTLPAPVQLGARTASAGAGSRAAGSDGDFAEVIVYDRALSREEQRQVESYLNSKYFNRTSMSAQSPLIWCDTGLNGLKRMTYSQDSGVILIEGTEGGRDAIWRLDATAGPGVRPTLVMSGQSVRDVQWAGQSRYVYASHLDTRHRIVRGDLASGESKELLQLWGNGNFDWFRATPKQLFLFGNISNTMAAALWACDLESGALRPVISTSDHPSGQAVTVKREPRNLPGGNPTCTIYRPANFDAGKQYPLVIGDTMITDPIYGEPFMTGMAACGAIVAVVERPWWTVGIEQWAQNVEALYDQLKSDPTVDTRRIYLFAASAETQHLSRLMETNAAPWRGLILLNPGVLPNFSKTSWFQSRPRILLDAGGEEHMEERFKKYQQEALAHGVVVEFFTHPGETHRTVGINAKLGRSREMMRFIFKE